jgi:hypothetical protein
LLDEEEVDGSVLICNGAPGYDSLTDLTPEPAGPNCAYGGIRIDAGMDLDRDGVLAPGEITRTEYVCNGAPGGGDPLADLVSIAIDPVTPPIVTGDTVQLTVKGTFSDASIAAITSFITWETSEPAVASVSAGGLVTALSAGETTITATEPSTALTDQVALTVLPLGLALSGTLVIHPPVPTIGLTESIQFLAVGSDAGEVPVGMTGLVTWESSNEAVATIDANGLAAAVSTGETTISATFTPQDTGVPETVNTLLTVQTIPEGAGGTIDWTTFEAVGFSPLGGLLDTVDGSAPDGFDPNNLGWYSEVEPPFAGLRIRSYSGYDPGAQDWTTVVTLGIAGQAPGVYDLTSDAFTAATTINPIPITLTGGPSVPGSSGTLVITRADAPGGRIEGYYRLVPCGSPFGCAITVQGAFSVTREADDLLADEGLQNDPVPLTLDVDHDGRVGAGSSYYKVAVAEDTAYVINARALTDEANVAVFKDDAFSDPFCDSRNAGTAMESCADITPFGITMLYVRVDYAGAGPGAAYVLSVNSTLFGAEGEDSPLILTPDTSGNGRTTYTHEGVVNHHSSYYQLGVVTGAGMTITMQPVSSDGDPLTLDAPVLTVYKDASLLDPFCTVQVDSTEISTCKGFVGLGVTDLYLQVDGANTGLGDYFSLQGLMVEDEGSTGGPEPLSLGVLRPSAVAGGTSFYTVTVTPEVEYLLGAYNPSEDVTLTVFSDDFGSTQACQSAQVGATDKTCQATAVGDTLYLTVDGSATVAGAAFGLSAVRVFPSEGTVTPFELTVDTPHTGTVAAAGSSFYTATLDPGVSYTLTLVGSENGLNYEVYSDDTLAEPIDNGSLFPPDVIDVYLPPGSGTVYLVVSGDYGGEFIVGITGGVFFAEATALTVNVPYPGQVDRTYSYYDLPVYAGLDYTVSLAGPRADVALEVTDGVGATICDSDLGGTSDEACPFAPLLDEVVTVHVNGAKTLAGSDYTLTALAALPDAEGNEQEPAPVPPETVYDGQVTVGASYYKVTGLAGDTLYRVLMDGLTADGDLYAYSDAFLNNACPPTMSGIDPESCDVLSNALGELYILVDGSKTSFGAFFTLQVGTPPDLSITLDSLTGLGDGTADVGFTITNNGYFPWVPVGFWVDFFPNPISPPLLGETSFAYVRIDNFSLAGSAFAGFTENFSLGGNVDGTAYLIVDSEQEVPESDETNNVSAGYSW